MNFKRHMRFRLWIISNIFHWSSMDRHVYCARMGQLGVINNKFDYRVWNSAMPLWKKNDHRVDEPSDNVGIPMSHILGKWYNITTVQTTECFERICMTMSCVIKQRIKYCSATLCIPFFLRPLLQLPLTCYEQIT